MVGKGGHKMVGFATKFFFKKMSSQVLGHAELLNKVSFFKVWKKMWA